MMKKTFRLFLFSVWTFIPLICVFLAYYGFYSYKTRLINERREVEANIILTGNKLTKCINEACPVTGCKTHDDWKAAYYKMFGNETACAVALYKAKSKYLKDKVPYPRHHKCYRRSDTEFFKQEGLDYKNMKAKYLASTNLPKVIESKSFKIPPKLNFVWLTSEKEFKTKKNHFFKINTYIFDNTKITPNWEHFLWTNNINWITPAAKKKLKEKKIHLRSIDEIHMTNPKHKALRTISKKYAAQHKWGLASDIARDLVEYYEGGIYVDGDYEILKSAELEKYMKSYRSFFGINDLSSSSDLFEIINAFMASEPKGKIIEKKLDLDYRNTIDLVNAPDYIKYPCDKIHNALFKTGPMILTVAFDLKKESSDALFPYCSLFQMPNDVFLCFNKTKLGRHAFHGGWANFLSRQKLIY